MFKRSDGVWVMPYRTVIDTGRMKDCHEEGPKSRLDLIFEDYLLSTRLSWAPQRWVKIIRSPVTPKVERPASVDSALEGSVNFEEKEELSRTAEQSSDGADEEEEVQAPSLQYAAKNRESVDESEPVLRVNLDELTAEEFASIKRQTHSHDLKMKQLAAPPKIIERLVERIERVSLEDMAQEDADRDAAEAAKKIPVEDKYTLPPFEEFMKKRSEQPTEEERVPVRRVVIGELTRYEQAAIERQEIRGQSTTRRSSASQNADRPIERIPRIRIDEDAMSDSSSRRSYYFGNSTRDRERDAREEVCNSTIYERCIQSFHDMKISSAQPAEGPEGRVPRLNFNEL